MRAMVVRLGYSSARPTVLEKIDEHGHPLLVAEAAQQRQLAAVKGHGKERSVPGSGAVIFVSARSCPSLAARIASSLGQSTRGASARLFTNVASLHDG
jgi:hypothetical protein